jgi:pantothenate kinase
MKTPADATTPSTPPWSVGDAVRHLCRAAQARPRRIVGLVGLPGGGKSTLAVQLVREVNQAEGEGTAMALGMDGFHLTRAQLAARPDAAAALARRGAPWTFDPAGLAARLRALRTAGTRVAWPGFSHEAGDPVEGAATVLPTARLVLVEGLYLLHRGDGWDLSGLLDECGYLDVPLDVALQRLAARHQAAWGMTPEQAWERIAANDRLNADVVMACRARADWRVAG